MFDKRKKQTHTEWLNDIPPDLWFRYCRNNITQKTNTNETGLQMNFGTFIQDYFLWFISYEGEKYWYDMFKNYSYRPETLYIE